MTSYAWLLDWDAVDGDLIDLVADLTPHNGGIDVVIRSQPVARFPRRTKLASGRVRGDGRAVHAITLVKATRACLAYIQDTYLNSGESVSDKMTVRLFEHDQDRWTAWNVYMELFNPAEDGTHTLGEFDNVQLRFHLVNEAA